MDYAYGHQRQNEFRLEKGTENGTEVVVHRLEPGFYMLGHIHEGGHERHGHGYLNESWVPSFTGELDRPIYLGYQIGTN